MKTVISIAILIIIIAVIYVIALILAYLIRFKIKPCKHCGSFMVFRGEHERPDGNVYLFQCPKCKAWEEVSVKEFNRLHEKYHTIT